MLFQPNAPAPLDSVTRQPVERCKDRIDLLLAQLSQAKARILIPTPVLSEILVASGSDKSAILNQIKRAYTFKIQSFDEMAAIEVALLTDTDLQSHRKLTPQETKAKVKYDRQIIAIAKVNQVKTIYSDDIQLGKKAQDNGIHAIRTEDLPLPVDPPQAELPLATI